MEYYLATKRNELARKTWRNLKCTLLTESADLKECVRVSLTLLQSGKGNIETVKRSADARVQESGGASR